MSDNSHLPPHIVPAHLGFLAIYSPSLGATDDTVENQIVYYSSSEPQDDRPGKRDALDPKAVQDALREQKNEQLRQIGFAQGMVEFGRTFSDGKSVDTIETAKARVILHEVEPGWWILASINLTILPGTSKTPGAKGAAAVEQRKTEYSSREVKPPTLLLQDLLRAHATFLLHHASSMSELSVRTKRSKFIGILGRYWDLFLPTWNVLMHGNPANNLYGGIKIAACGELGMGVGEEERGSGEREVLEGFVGRIDGLVDVIVSKFGVGDSPPESEKNAAERDQTNPTEPWLGSGDDPAAEDGAVFLGTGALSRRSLRDVSHWVEDLYRWGSQTYGVMDNPTSNRRARGSKPRSRAKKSETPTRAQKNSRQVSVVNSHNESSRDPSPRPMNTIPPTPVNEEDPANKLDQGQSNYTSTDGDPAMGNKFVQYLKFGYGTHWSVGSSPSRDEGHGEAPAAEEPSAHTGGAAAKEVASNNTASLPRGRTHTYDDSIGHYLIGLLGDLEEEAGQDDPASYDDDGENSRLLLRTLTLELEDEVDSRPEVDMSIDLESTKNEEAPLTTKDRNKTKKLRVVVYANKPFIFVLLFDPATNALALSNLYRSLHHQIGPLIKPLLNSTSFRASKPDIGGGGKGDSVTPIYDLVWDSNLLTVTSSIPNIPDPYLAHPKPGRQAAWARIEAINTHMQIINTRVATAEGVEKERTCKTSRGWWVVWTRVPDADYRREVRPSSDTSRRTSASDMVHEHAAEDSPKGKEIFLIRRASDNVGGKLSGRLVSGSSGGGNAGWVSGPGRLAQGIGVDTKRYIESLLNLTG